MPLFDGLKPNQVADLAPLFTRVTFAADQTIFVEGEQAQTAYVSIVTTSFAVFGPISSRGSSHDIVRTFGGRRVGDHGRAPSGGTGVF